MTERLSIDPQHPDPAVLERAAKVLRAGRLVAFPTETVYGLGALALVPEAVERIFEAKGRPATNPLIVHVADLAQARSLARSWPAQAERLAEVFWPGPLSLVLPKQPSVPDIVTAGGPTVALRMPAHPVALALLRATGAPLAAPSANRSTHISATTAEHVARSLGERVDLIFDAGATSGGLESTVVDLTGPVARVLRPGLIGIAELEAALGERVQLASAAMETHQAQPSPGMQARHYAPGVPLECVTGSARARVTQCVAACERVGWLTLGEPHGRLPEGIVVIGLPLDVEGYSSGLYAALHEFESAGVERIVVELPPDRPEWLAVRDRLTRASHPA